MFLRVYFQKYEEMPRMLHLKNLKMKINENIIFICLCLYVYIYMFMLICNIFKCFYWRKIIRFFVLFTAESVRTSHCKKKVLNFIHNLPHIWVRIPILVKKFFNNWLGHWGGQNIKNITFLFSVKYRQYNINSVPNWLFNCVFASMVNLVNRIKTLIIEKIFNTYIDKCVKSAETFQSYHSQLAIYVIKVLAELPYL